MDLYQTPIVAVEALLRHVQHFPADYGNPPWRRHRYLLDVLRAARSRGHGSDLVDYGRPDWLSSRRDFLMERKVPDGCEGIVTNAPFKLAKQFVAHALDLCPLVIACCGSPSWRSSVAHRILENRGLARIHVFRRRFPMMHRHGWEGTKAGSAMAFGWFVWDRSHAVPTTIDRISWERP